MGSLFSTQISTVHI